MKCRDNSPNEIERQVTAHLVYKGQLALLYRFLETKFYCHEIGQLPHQSTFFPWGAVQHRWRSLFLDAFLSLRMSFRRRRDSYSPRERTVPNAWSRNKTKKSGHIFPYLNFMEKAALLVRTVYAGTGSESERKGETF